MPKIPRHRIIMNQGTRVSNTTWKMNPAGSDERECGDKKNKKKVAFCMLKDAMHSKHI